MFKHIVNSRLPLLVYSPPGVVDEPYSRAIANAGGLPVIDTEFLRLSRAKEAISSLAAGEGLFGIRLTGDNQALAQWLGKKPWANLDAVVVAPGLDNTYPELSLTGTHATVLAEVLAESDADQLTALSPAAVIVKGNEAGGRVSTKSAFVLTQWYLENSQWPVFVHGGVGLHTGAGIFAAGACGVVLDAQLYLSEESPLADNFKKQMATLTENDTTVVGETLGLTTRFFAKPATQAVRDLKEREAVLSTTGDNAPADFYADIRDRITLVNDARATVAQSLFYLGQDAVFANSFAARGESVKEMVTAFFQRIGEKLAAVDAHDPLVADSPLAREHGVTYPVMQGPMANISDTAEFAEAVRKNGGLPFFAIGNLPADLAETVIENGVGKCETFGAGLVGIEALNPYLPDHLKTIESNQVPFALFAGGSPAQVTSLEASGTRTYLHTPSVVMLENALDGGCTRFILEGREAGGHVGNLNSLVLWENALQFFETLDAGQQERLTVVFAGGIATATAAWFISGMTADLAGRGMKIGILAGSPYLFTKEIVATGAVKEKYQQVIMDAQDTFLVGQTVGLALRTVETPFSKTIRDNEYERLKEKLDLTSRKEAFELDNTCSLLIAAKAFAPDFKTSGKLIRYDDAAHYAKGNFSVGASLSLFSEPVTIAEVHDRFFNTKSGLTANLNQLEVLTSPERLLNEEVAVVGIGCLMPGATDPDTFWENILSKKSFLSEMAPDRFDPSLYYDPDKNAADKSYSKIAGQVTDFVFDHDRYGYTEDKAKNLSRSQQMVLEAAYRAVADAGYLDDQDRLPNAMGSRTGVILGSCHGNELTSNLHLKYYYPEVAWHLDQIDAFTRLPEKDREAILADLRDGMSPAEKYEPVHGVLLNMEAARIAHHLGATGVNYSVDAACATSLAALDCAVRELLAGAHDVMITGGLNTNLAPETFIGFSKMGALSNDGSYPFDSRANGFVVGEGAGVVVLKRARQAIADGDRIYGIIKAIGSSSDGKGKAIAAPNPAGQELCMQRCLKKLEGDIALTDIDYIEAHGTSTIMGDAAEAASIREVYGQAGQVGVSSVKSQIGHLLGGAGVAGVIKVLLALTHKTLPPNGGFEKPSDNVDFEGTGLYIIDKARQWTVDKGKCRHAAVSSFGFGGINYHCILSEYNESFQPRVRRIFSDPGYDFNEDRIVVAGLGVVLPGAPNVNTFWEKLVTGESTVSPLPDRWFHNEYYANMADENYHLPMVKAGVVHDYEPSLLKYRIPPKVAESMDRAQIFGLDAADQAIEQAGRDVLLAKDNRTAVVLGTIPGEKNAESVLRARLVKIENILRKASGLPDDKKEALVSALGDSLRQRYAGYNEDTLPGLLSNIITGRIANCFGTNGANFVVDASCASATMTFDIAIKALRAKEYDFVLAGGADTNLYPTLMISFKRLGLLSDGECTFFDENGKGYIMGEGAAIAVLTTYKKAKENKMPIYGEIHGMGMASSVSEHILSPSQRALEVAADRCYKTVQPGRDRIRHLDVFALSHSFLDGVEMQAMENTFTQPVRIDNIKPRFGYFKAANPAVVMAKLMLMNRHGKLVPNTSFNPETSLLSKTSVMMPETGVYDAGRQPLWFATNIIGIGGNHIHMVAGSLPGFLEQASEAALDSDMSSTAEAIELSGKASAVPWAANSTGMRTVALVSGQGAQYPGMMRDLYDTHPVIRDRMDTADRQFADQRGYSLLSIMFNPDGAKRLNQTGNTQPAVFLASACIFDYLAERGFSPDLFIGHSIGEYTALYCNRMLDFETAFSLVIHRGEVMRQATEERPGRIMVVLADDTTAQRLIDQSGLPDLWVANKNSPTQTAVSGAASSIDAFCEYLARGEVTAKKLALSGAFHTPLFNSAAEKMKHRLARVSFAPVNFTRIISNVTGQPYPDDETAIKELLVRQITSPVEFVQSVRNACGDDKTVLVETGVGRILTNLARKMDVEMDNLVVTAEPRKGEAVTLENAVASLALDSQPVSGFKTPEARQTSPASVGNLPSLPELPPAPGRLSDLELRPDENFDAFKAKNAAALDRLAFQQYQESRRQQAARRFERFDFCAESIVVAGVSVGLPGKSREVFATDNFEQILRGTNLIDPLSESAKEKIVDKNITRVFKKPDGNAEFVDIHDSSEVIQLAGQLGHFDLRDYGLDPLAEVFQSRSVALALAAGLEALRDAGIPLVQQYRQMSSGDSVPDGFALPKQMQDRTGVIMTSLFADTEVLARHMEDYFYETYYVRAYEEFESMYYQLMEHAKDREVKNRLTEWFFKVRAARRESGAFKMDRNFIANVSSLGSAFFAERIKAKGPNTLVSGACASTTQAIAVAEDWLRTGRCDRVIVIGGEDATAEEQNPWLGSGFLAVGAASVEKTVQRAAKPFDRARNGMILGAGAVSLILERQSTVAARGLRGQAELLGATLGNSAHHPYQFNVDNLASAMRDFVTTVEKRHQLRAEEYAEKLVFMSHETYTPARGGSADAEVSALKKAYPDDYKRVTITNTKGYTGHTLGAAIEDAVLIKALQAGTVPPVANLTDIPEEFRELKLGRQQVHGDFQYGLHLSAGFGSHYAFAFFKRQQEAAREGNPVYQSWLNDIAGCDQAELKVVDRTLRAVSGKEMTANPTLNPKPVSAPDLVSHPATQNTLAEIKTIMAEHTGYAEDMLAADLDMEADLGIDTVKQVEVFGKICKHFGLTVPEDVRLRDMNTIGLVEKFIVDQLGTAVPAGSAEDEKKSATDILSQIVSIVSEHTGYAEDMLGADLDMEADLGIDTVKQVEVFGKICKHFGLTVPEDVRLRDMNTIGLVGEFIAAQLTVDAPIKTQMAELSDPSVRDNALTERLLETGNVGGVERFVTRLRQVDTPQVVDNDFFAGRTFLLTNDNYGFAKAFEDIVIAAGGQVITVGEDTGCNFTGNMTDPETVHDVMSKITGAYQDISGVFHFAPLDVYFDLDRSDSPPMDPQADAVKSFFLMIKHLRPFLDRADTIISLPAFESVVFPYPSVSTDGTSRDICPLFAGLAGMLKTINKELPQTLVRVVDFSVLAPFNEIETIVRQYAAEVSSDDTRVECGYADSRKYHLQLVDKAASEDEPLISKGDTVVVTGGARGITMEILRAVAAEYKPRLVILGRSDISVADDYSPDMDERAIMEQLKKGAMKGAKPLVLKQAAQKIVNAGKSAANIKALEAAGASVTYHAVDVTDRQRVQTVLAEYSRIDGVLHAAGLEESVFFEKKELASFSRVFDVKVVGAKNLMTAVQGKDCRYFIGFSSVTAKFGNEAQVDYTGANDMLAKMIMAYSRKMGMTGKIIGWTAWEEVGMAASGTVNAVLKERGVTFLPVDRGVACFMAEMRDNQESEVVFTGRDVAMDSDGLFQTTETVRPVAAGFPLIDSQLAEAGKTTFFRVLDVKRDLFLDDHSLDGVPIMPGAVGAELMAEAALLAAGQQGRVAAVEDFSIPYGVKLLRRQPKHLMIETAGPDSDGQCQCAIHSTVQTPQGKQQKLHYTGRVVLSKNGYQKLKTEIPGQDILSFDGNAQDAVYHPAGLFMTGRFRTIQDIVYIAEGVLVTRVCDTATNDFIAGDFTPTMQFDPIMVDAMFQSTGVLEMLQAKSFSLPSGFTRARLYRPIEPRKEYLCVVRRNDLKPAEDSDMVAYHLELADAGGNLYMEIEDFKMVRLHAMSVDEGPAAKLHERVAAMATA